MGQKGKILCISIISALILLCCIFFMAFSKSKPGLECTIADYGTKSFRVMVSDKETDFLKQHPSLQTKPLTVTVKDKNDLAAFKIGDKVKIVFDGSVQESSPPSVNAEEITLILRN